MRLKSIVECKPVEVLSDPLLDQVEKTYNSSFPESERRSFGLVRDLVKAEPRFVVYALLKEDVYVGFITAWLFDKFTYVEHFAIDESARNGGLGADAMKQFLASCGTPVVLEVEMPDDEMSKRRVGFYERLGFVLDHHPYRQPPYRKGEEWLDMRLMTYRIQDMADCYEQVKGCIYKYVYLVEL